MISFEKHAFKGLDAELATVYSMAQQMAALIADQLTIFEKALASDVSDHADAKAIDKKINQLEAEIEGHISTVLSKYTLVGDELRFAITMLKLSSTLERMGDMSKNCVKRTVRLLKPVLPEFAKEALALKGMIVQMLATSMELVKEYDEEKADRLMMQEDEVDGLYKKIQLVLHQDIGNHARLLETTHMLFIIKNLERLADLTLDIVKLCHYIHKGKKFEWTTS